MLGDFNDKCIDWHLPHANSEVGNKLVDILDQNNLYQIVKEPTRYSDNGAHLLDLIITDSPHLFLNSGVSPPLANLDHCTIYGTLNINLHRSKAFKRIVWDFKSADKGILNEAMAQAPWDVPYILYDDVNEIVEYNRSLITSVCTENIKNKSVTIRTKDKPWMCNEVRYLLRKRDRCFKKYKRTLSEQDKFYFYLARREANRAKRNAKKRFDNKMVTNFSKPNLSSREFWKLSKRLLGDKSDRNIPPLIHDDNIVSDNENKANLFNAYFVSISSLDIDRAPPQLPAFNFKTDKRIELVQTTESEVEKLLSTLNPHKSTGPDGIGNWVLKTCSHTLAKPLTTLFNKLLENGNFPKEWKTASVCPVYKKGNKSEVGNYRPISLLCNMSKVLEKIVYKKLYEYLMEHNLLIEHNSGFKKNDSTINQLLKLIHQIYTDLNEGKDTCLVFLDVSKAFDKVWIDGLLFKIKQLGIVGPLFNWLRSYVSGRHQKVVLNGCQSTICSLTAGVPQGSILGPLLFLIYVNDITKNMECTINLFADDTSVQKRIDNAASFDIVNRDLQRLTSYGAQWLVKFNAVKTDYMITQKPICPYHPNLILNGETISESENHTHLGVTINNKLSWSVHINMAIAKADRRLSVIRRCRNQIPQSCRETLYKTIIRPILDYGDIIYDSCLKAESESLEKFQRKCALVCTGAFKITSQEKLLKELGWSKLQNRRTMHRLNLFYKIVNSLVPSYLKQACRQIPHNTDNYRLPRNNSILVPFIKRVLLSKNYS